jgi:hypothetical protein
VTTPPVTVRLPAQHHGLIRRVAALIKADDAFSSALSALTEDATAQRRSITERRSELDQRSLCGEFEQLEKRVGELEFELGRLNASVKSAPEVAYEGALATEGSANRQSREAVHEEKGQPAKPLSRTRELAKALLAEQILDADGKERVLTRAEMEARVAEELGVSRNAAQSATSWAVRTYDADNEARRTHRVPVARKIGEDLRTKMRTLAAQGATRREIAQSVGANVRTISKHLRR